MLKRKKNWNLIFDLDGTLLNTITGISAAANNAVTRLGQINYRFHQYNSLNELQTKEFVGDGAKVLMSRILKHHLTSPPTETELNLSLQYFLESYKSICLKEKFQPKLYPGVVSGLDKLDKLDANLIICTNKPEDIAREMISNNNEISRFFIPVNHFVTGAVEGLPKKPEKEHVLRAISSSFNTNKFLREKTIIIGDGLNDVLVANALQCRSIAVTYGFSKTNELIELKPSSVCSDFETAVDIATNWILEDNS